MVNYSVVAKHINECKMINWHSCLKYKTKHVLQLIIFEQENNKSEYRVSQLDFAVQNALHVVLEGKKGVL